MNAKLMMIVRAALKGINLYLFMCMFSAPTLCISLRSPLVVARRLTSSIVMHVKQRPLVTSGCVGMIILGAVLMRQRPVQSRFSRMVQRISTFWRRMFKRNTRVKKLNLSHHRNVGDILEHINERLELEELDLTGAAWVPFDRERTIYAKTIAQTPNLKVLSVRGSDLTRGVLDAIGNSRSIEELNCGETVLPDRLECLRYVRRLRLTSCNIQPHQLRSLCALQQLELLDLSGNNLRHLPEGLFQLPHVQIHVRRVDLSDAQQANYAAKYPNKLVVT